MIDDSHPPMGVIDETAETQKALPLILQIFMCINTYTYTYIVRLVPLPIAMQVFRFRAHVKCLKDLNDNDNRC
jgi:hypothetical protein